MYFDLAEIEDLIAGMPDTYHKLSDPTRCLSLSVLTFARDRWRWRVNGDKPDDSQWDTALAMVDGAIEELLQTMLTGMVLLWASNDIPDGFLLCDGAAVSRTDYAPLFAALGTIYGAGDGNTTFNLPDLTGRVVVGQDTTGAIFASLGESGGETEHTLTVGEMPEHAHSESMQYDAPVGMGEIPAIAPVITGVTDTGGTGGGAAHNNVQPYLVMVHIIKT